MGVVKCLAPFVPLSEAFTAYIVWSGSCIIYAKMACDLYVWFYAAGIYGH